MTQALRIDVDAARVRAAFASLRRKFADLRAAWSQTGARMEEAASPFVPIESGRLVDNLRSQAGPDGVELISDLPYSAVQDRGWPGHNIAGHHFMDRAADAAGGAAVAELAPAMQSVIDRVGLR